MFKNLFNSFLFAWCGLRTVWREERNFRILFFVGFVAVVFAIVYKFSFAELGFIVFAVTMVLASEIMNTAIEDLCNKIEPNRDPMIGKVKDMTSAFTLVSVVGALVIGILVFGNHFL